MCVLLGLSKTLWFQAASRLQERARAGVREPRTPPRKPLLPAQASTRPSGKKGDEAPSARMLMQREMARHLPQSHVLRISQMGGDSRIQVRKTRASCYMLPSCMDSLPCSRIVQWRRFVGTAMQGLAEKCELLSARLASLENIAEAVNTGACSCPLRTR